MAKIDVSKIPGFEEMTAEEKVAALVEYEVEDPAPADPDAKLKGALSRANSDAAEWKRKYLATLDDAKRAEEERAERDKAVETELRDLRRERDVSGYLAQYLALGYDRDLALRAAEATADGNAAEIIKCQQTAIEAAKKEAEAAVLGKQPTLSVGTPPTTTQAEDDAKAKMRKYFGLA